MRFVRVNSKPAINQHLTLKQNVDNAIDEISLIKNKRDSDFNQHNLIKIKSSTLNFQAANDNQVITKAFVDHFHQ